jgi:hypothetical protein
MVDSNGRVVELEDDAMLPPAGASAAAAAPEVGKPTPVETPVQKDTGIQNNGR